MAQRVVIPGFRKIETSGGGEVTGNYNDLANKPSINNVHLVGNLKTVDLKLTDPTLTEEGVPAEAKEVGLRLESHSTSLTELSEQLGSHTIKSDVPENAVFTDTVYDDTEIKESLSKQSSEMMDIKMLGWSVPKECPIQNEVNENQFIQKVGRVYLGSLDYGEQVAYGVYTYAIQNKIKVHLDTKTASNIYCRDYLTVSWNKLTSQGKVDTNHIASSGDGAIGFNTTRSAEQFKEAMQGKYLYYELAAPITTVIDGNEKVVKITEDVASLLKRIEALEALTTKTDTTKTDTNTTVTE